MDDERLKGLSVNSGLSDSPFILKSVPITCTDFYSFLQFLFLTDTSFH